MPPIDFKKVVIVILVVILLARMPDVLRWIALFRLWLSRERFYRLRKAGVFPPPVYDIANKRPFYTRDLQLKCILIRESGIGFNGQPTLFYKPLKGCKSRDRFNPQIDRYVQILRGMGFKANSKTVRMVIKVMYSKGLDGRADGIVIRDLARYISQGTIPDVQSP